MGLVTAGLMNKQIASDLGVSEITVKIHRGHAMRKHAAESFQLIPKSGGPSRLSSHSNGQGSGRPGLRQPSRSHCFTGTKPRPSTQMTRSLSVPQTYASATHP